MVSIVIPLYNKEQSICKTIKSVLQQTYTDFELIVVDNGSTDGSLNEVSKIHDKRIRLLHQPIRGVSAARNMGISAANTEYVALLDGDDLWNENCLMELVQLAKDFPDAGMCGVNYADISDGKILPYNQGLQEGYRDYVNNYFGTNHGDLFCASSVMLKKNVAISVGLFDERIAYAEDLEFWYRTILNSKVAFYNKVFAYYNKDAENRAEENINAHFDIKKRMDYYIDKFVPYFSTNQSFSKFINVRIAWNILKGDYYFGDKYDREATDKIVAQMRYDDMPKKYKWIFTTPRFIGKVVYELSKYIQKLK